MTNTQRATTVNGKRSVRIEMDGDTQIIRLPADIRFEGDFADLRRDQSTGDVILSSRPKPKTWDELFAVLDEIGPAPDEFMADRPMNVPATERGVFDDDLA